MNEKEKLKQLEKGRDAPAGDAPNDAAILFPKPKEWEFGGKVYTLHPMRFSEIELLIEISEIDLGVVKKGDTAKIVELTSEILGEPDLVFVKKNLDPIEFQDLIKTVQELNTTGVPVNKKKALARLSA